MQLRHIVPGTMEWIDAVGAERDGGQGEDALTPEQRLRLRQAQARRFSSAARLFREVASAAAGGRTVQSLAGGSASR